MNDFMMWSGWIPFAWTLLHVLWQSALVALLMAGILSLLPAARSGTRYAVTLSALLLCLLSAAATFGILRSPAARHADDVVVTREHSSQAPGFAHVANSFPDPPAVLPGSDRADHPQPHRDDAPEFLSAQRAAWLGAAWCAGALFMLLRTSLLLAATRRIVRSTVPVTDEQTLHLLQETRALLGMRRPVQLLRCDRLRSAAAVGFLKPAILLPASMLCGLSTDQLRLILSHELAHLKRQDFLINIAQMLIESLLFFSPAVWWISRQIRREREACCDEIAARAGSRRSDYAAALADWAQTMTERIPAPALAATGRDGALLDRAQRVLDPNHRPRTLLPLRTLVGTLSFSVLLLAVIVGGTGLAARAVADILTPQQRLEMLTETAHHTGLPPAPLTSRSVDPIIVTGTWHLPEDHPGFVRWQPHRSIHITGRVVSDGVTTSVRGLAHADGHFEVPASPGDLTILITGEGFAPASVGPIRITSNAVPDPFELRLHRGFPAALRLVNETGEGIAGARVTLSATAHGAANQSEHRSNDDGVIDIAHAWPGQYELTARIAGFEEVVRVPIRFEPNEPVAHAFVRALPLTGRVVDVRGETISGARIRRAAAIGDQPELFGERGEIVAESDESGQFSITTLRRGVRYALVAESDDHAPTLLVDRHAGDRDVEVILTDDRTIIGTVKASDLAHLPTQGGRTVIRIAQQLNLDRSAGYRTHRTIPVELDGDRAGTFRAAHLFAAETWIRTDAGEISIGIAEDGIRHIEADIPGTAAYTCEVTITVRPPEGHPAPAGTLMIARVRSDASAAQAILAPLTDGRAVLRAAPGDQLHIMPSAMLGAWFDGPVTAHIHDGDTRRNIEIPAIPAGAIRVRIEDPAATSSDSLWTCTVRAADDSRITSAGQPFNASVRADAGGSALLTPIPLDNTYTVIASSGVRFLARPDVTVDERTPAPEAVLDARPMRDIVIRVTDANGLPLHGRAVSLLWLFDGHTFGASPAPRTGANGTVRLRDIPMQSGGTYSIDLPEERAAAHLRVPLNFSAEIQTIVLPSSDGTDTAQQPHRRER